MKATIRRLRHHGRALPLRLWLVLAVAAVVGAGFLAQLTLTAIVLRQEQGGASTLSSPPHLSGGVWAAVELGTFALTLAIVVWLIGPPVLRPLGALSQAVESIAGGDLSVHLAPSPVREIAEVSAALEGMSAALQQALERQSALEEERRLFVSAIAHDLRTPLFMLRGYLRGLERGVATTPEKIAHYIDASRGQADALERLITDLFAYTRLEYLEVEPERALVDLSALLRQAAEDARPAATAKELRITLDLPEELCFVMGDSYLLARAFANLLDNAVRYTPEQGWIGIHCDRQEGSLALAIEDTGPGIAAHDLPHLFTPLYRGDASRNRQTGGTGLGLAIARRILQAHGGDLTAANSVLGGAIFTATVPATEPAHPAADMTPVAS